MVSGLDIHYDLGDPHPLVGRRIADGPVELLDGTPTTIAELLRPARAVVITTPGGVAADSVSGWHDRVHTVAVRSIPDLDAAAVLVRPDGYVAWAMPGSADLATALGRWFGVAHETEHTIAA